MIGCGAPARASAPCLGGVQDGGGRRGWEVPQHRGQEQGPLGAAHLGYQVRAAPLRIFRASEGDLGPGAGRAVLGRPARLWLPGCGVAPGHGVTRGLGPCWPWSAGGAAALEKTLC